MLKPVSLLVLNELSDRPHNAYIKCFASRMKEKKAAFRMLKRQNIGSFSLKLLWLFQGLWNHWFSKGGDLMNQELTPEQVIEMGKMWGDVYLSTLNPEELLKKFGPEKVLEKFSPEERLRGLSVKEIENYLRKIKKQQ